MFPCNDTSAGVRPDQRHGRPPAEPLCRCRTFGATILGSDLGYASESLDEETECVYSRISERHCCRGLLSPLLTDLFVPCRNTDMNIPNGLLMFSSLTVNGI